MSQILRQLASSCFLTCCSGGFGARGRGRGGARGVRESARAQGAPSGRIQEQVAVIKSVLGQVEALKRSRRYEEAEEACLAALVLAENIGDLQVQIIVIQTLAQLCQSQHKNYQATEYFEKSYFFFFFILCVYVCARACMCSVCFTMH